MNFVLVPVPTSTTIGKMAGDPQNFIARWNLQIIFLFGTLIFCASHETN